MVARQGVIDLFGREAPAPAERAPLPASIPPGRLVELSGDVASARTTTAVSIVIRAQAQGEPVAWIQPEGGPVYPPDLQANGVDLDTLVVVHVPRRAGPHALARAAELLLRSGGFGLVVADLTDGVPDGTAWQGRLASLAQKHASGVALLTASAESAPSLGPMIAVRVAPVRERRAPGRYAVEHRVLKDKLGQSLHPAPDRRRAPSGLP